MAVIVKEGKEKRNCTQQFETGNNNINNSRKIIEKHDAISTTSSDVDIDSLTERQSSTTTSRKI